TPRPGFDLTARAPLSTARAASPLASSPLNSAGRRPLKPPRAKPATPWRKRSLRKTGSLARPFVKRDRAGKLPLAPFFEELSMWICSKCGENVEDDFEVCWSCGSNKEGTPNPEFLPEREAVMGDQAYQTQQAALREENLVTVATFGNAPEAHMVRSRL